MKILGYVIAALIGVIVFLLQRLSVRRNELKLLKCQLETAEKEKDGYARQVQRLTSAAEIVSENRKEADEKIEELHSGDAVSNALDELRKR